MTYLKNDNYRISTIYSLDKGELPLNNGLELAKRCDNSNSWYTLCFIRYDKKEQWCDIEGVGTRLLDVEKDDWECVKQMIETASKLIITANTI